jgi:hypothetical protein
MKRDKKMNRSIIPLYKDTEDQKCEDCEEYPAIVAIGEEAYLCRDCVLNFIDELKSFLSQAS